MIEKVGESTLIFHERGYLQRKNDEQEIDFSNIFRWIFNRKEGSISLEHLRRGINHPVFLFYMIPITSSSLASIDPHLCEDDAYFGQITFDHYSLRLNWRVIGPKKNEEIDYYYACLSAS